MSGSALSKARLGRLHLAMTRYVDAGAVPGVVTLVSCGDELYVDAIGDKAFAAVDPMRRDTIFRIASMTKPITAVAAMILVEECRIRLDEPIDSWVPELAGRKVLKRIDGPLEDTVPASRPLTVRDLLTFRMGFGITFGPPTGSPIEQAATASRVLSLPPGPPLAADEWLKRLGNLPLMYQPGERWIYHTSYDVLGMLIARASGQSLETFMRERILAPLGMKDTAFSVPEAKLARFPACYQPDAQGTGIELGDAPDRSAWGKPPLFPQGGGGLVSTVDDYHAFGRMMLNGGRHGKERILSRASVEAMTTNQITQEQKDAASFLPGFFESNGWGLGVSMVTKRTDVAAQPGQFGWSGVFGSTWFSDPREDLVAILMIQRMYFGPEPAGIWSHFSTGVYQALED